MTSKTVAILILGAGLSVGLVLAGSTTPALAQGDRCSDLWYERNEIYARNGHCFRTRRARAVFGAGCFPPYGRLSRAEQRRVRDIQSEEDDLGCPR